MVRSFLIPRRGVLKYLGITSWYANYFQIIPLQKIHVELKKRDDFFLNNWGLWRIYKCSLYFSFNFPVLELFQNKNVWGKMYFMNIENWLETAQYEVWQYVKINVPYSLGIGLITSWAEDYTWFQDSFLGPKSITLPRTGLIR